MCSKKSSSIDNFAEYYKTFKNCLSDDELEYMDDEFENLENEIDTNYEKLSEYKAYFKNDDNTKEDIIKKSLELVKFCKNIINDCYFAKVDSIETQHDDMKLQKTYKKLFNEHHDPDIAFENLMNKIIAHKITI